MNNTEERTTPQVKVRPYYGLQVISVIFKALSVITVIATIVIVVNNSFEFGFSGQRPPLAEFYLGTWILRDSIIGLTIALVLFVIAQLIDVQINMAKQMRQLVDLVEHQSEQLEDLRKSFMVIRSTIQVRQHRQSSSEQPEAVSVIKKGSQ